MFDRIVPFNHSFISQGRTALKNAVENSHHECVEVLMAYTGGKPNSRWYLATPGAHCGGALAGAVWQSHSPLYRR